MIALWLKNLKRPGLLDALPFLTGHPSLPVQTEIEKNKLKRVI